MGKVSVRCQNVSLDEALRQVLGKNFTFRIVDNTVVIRPQETKPDPVQQRVAKGRCECSRITFAGGDRLLKVRRWELRQIWMENSLFLFPNTAGTVLQFSFIG